MAWIIALIFFIIDQLTKWQIVSHFRLGQVHNVIPGLLDWVFVENTRGAYGLFGDRPWFLITISLVAFVAIWLAFRKRAATSPWTRYQASIRSAPDRLAASVLSGCGSAL